MRYSNPSRHFTPRRQCGFTLTELAMVLAIFALLAFMMIPTSTALIDNSRRSETLTKMRHIETALTNFVMVNKRLPCPADGTANTGAENGTNGVCNADQGNGVVPWAALSLTRSDVEDAWANRITYRAGFGLTVAGALDMTSCDPAGTKDEGGYSGTDISTHACDSTCTGSFVAGNCTSPTRFLMGKGLNVSDGTNSLATYTNPSGGAAFILISHGVNQYGALNSFGTYMATAARGVAGTLENPNRNLNTLTVTSGVPPTFNVRDLADTSDTATYFDDIVLYSTILGIVNQAHLGPRSH